MPDPRDITTATEQTPTFNNQYELGSVPKRLEQQIEFLRRGNIAPIGTVTLRTSQTTTVVSAPYLVSSNSYVDLMPLSSAAAAEKYAAAGTFWVTPAKGSFTINHTASATTRAYIWVAFSGIR